MFIGAAIEPLLDWRGAVEALRRGHALGRPQVADMITPCAAGELLCRSASVPQLGSGAKCVTIYPGNPAVRPPRPTVQGVFILFSDEDGAPRAVIDGALLTKWKTVADSLLGASILARPAPRSLAILGGGAIAAALLPAYRQYFPSIADIRLWSRRRSAQDLASTPDGAQVRSCESVREATDGADIISCATAATLPILSASDVSRGAHVDLIGAHNRHMRESDDTLIAKARIHVDCLDTTIDHIGELSIPIAQGTIARSAVRGDLYDLLERGAPARRPDDITLFKNGGGAHLDLMMATYILERASGRS